MEGVIGVVKKYSTDYALAVQLFDSSPTRPYTPLLIIDGEARHLAITVAYVSELMDGFEAFVKEGLGDLETLAKGGGLEAQVYAYPLGRVVGEDGDKVIVDPGNEPIRAGSPVLAFSLNKSITPSPMPKLPIRFKLINGSQVLVDSSMLNQHLGIYGPTGSGKSFLAQTMTRQLAQLGFSIIVVDPHGEHARALRDIAEVVDGAMVKVRNLRAVTSVILSLGEPYGLRYNVHEQYILSALTSCLEEDECGQGNYSAFLRQVRTRASGARDYTQEILQTALMRIRADVEELFRARATIQEILTNSLLPSKVTVIDLSRVRFIEVQQAIVAELAEALLKELMTRPRAVCLVVDEAPRFAPEEDYSISARALVSFAREARKFGGCLVVISQRVKGAVKAQLRTNLGSALVNRLNDADFQEISSLYNVTAKTAPVLGNHEFMLLGVLNPFTRPIVVRAWHA